MLTGPNPNPPIALMAFEGNNNSQTTLQVPYGSKIPYIFSMYWDIFGKIVAFGDLTDIKTVSTGTTPVKVYIDGQTLCVDTPVSGHISIYFINGTKLYSTKKPSGKISVPFNHKGILIIKSNHGWVRKVK